MCGSVHHQRSQQDFELMIILHLIVVELECGPMPNVTAALLNICSTPQSLADAHY